MSSHVRLNGRTTVFFALAIILFLTHVCEPAAKAKGKGKAKSRSKVAAALNQNCVEGQAYHNDTEKCYEVDSQGPCNEQMKFYVDTETEGFGDCECEKSECPSETPKIYWLPEDRCYTAYEIGPCAKNQWLMLNSTGDAECQKNPCLTNALFLEPDRIEIGNNSDASENVTTPRSGAYREVEQVQEIEQGFCQCSALKKLEDSSNGDECACVAFVFQSIGAMSKINFGFVVLAVVAGYFSSRSLQLNSYTIW